MFYVILYHTYRRFTSLYVIFVAFLLAFEHGLLFLRDMSSFLELVFLCIFSFCETRLPQCVYRPWDHLSWFEKMEIHCKSLVALCLLGCSLTLVCVVRFNNLSVIIFHLQILPFPLPHRGHIKIACKIQHTTQRSAKTCQTKPQQIIQSPKIQNQTHKY